MILKVDDGEGGQRADRDYKNLDLLPLPNRNHQTCMLDPYVVRRLWDYFVRHLLGAESPPGYGIHDPA